MEDAAKKLMKDLLEEGRRDDDVRRGLISEGYATEGFDAVCAALKDELGITDPPPESVVPAPKPMQEEVREYSEKAEQSHSSRFWTNVMKLVGGLLVLVVGILLLAGIGPRMWQTMFGDFDSARETRNPADIARESQLRTFQIAAEVYKSKLLDYGGLCESIGIDAEVYSCTENTEAYAIEAPLSNDRYFCVDNTGFAGITSASHGSKKACPQ